MSFARSAPLVFVLFVLGALPSATSCEAEGGTNSNCTNAKPWAPGIDECDGGYVHRKSAEHCPTPEWDESQGGRSSGGEECSLDADCTTGTHCVARPGWTTDCITPECMTDADCALGSVCVCAPGYLLGDSYREVAFGICVHAGCTTDAECGTGLLCVSSLPVDEYSEFRCQSGADE